MNQLIRFLLKSNSYLFFVTIVFTILAIEFGGIWKIIPYIFILFFFYDWNVSPKLNKTWLYLETLPVTLFGRYVLRVILPFVFCFVILFCLEVFKKWGDIDASKAILDSLRQSSVFVISSILAGSLSGYIFFIIFFHLVLLGLSYFHFYVIYFLFFMFSYSYYYLSKARVSKAKFVYAPLLICMVLFLSGNFLRESIYKIGLYIPIKPIQIFSAQVLISENSFSDNDVLLQKIENIVVTGKKCSPTCSKLAQALEEFPQNWNLDRIQNYLNSPEQSKQIYALEILRSSRKVLFFSRVMQLAQSENTDISNSALMVLNNWGIHSFDDVPTTQVF